MRPSVLWWETLSTRVSVVLHISSCSSRKRWSANCGKLLRSGNQTSFHLIFSSNHCNLTGVIVLLKVPIIHLGIHWWPQMGEKCLLWHRSPHLYGSHIHTLSYGPLHFFKELSSSTVLAATQTHFSNTWGSWHFQHHVFLSIPGSEI